MSQNWPMARLFLVAQQAVDDIHADWITIDTTTPKRRRLAALVLNAQLYQDASEASVTVCALD
jgi:hypothetical protein